MEPIDIIVICIVALIVLCAIAYIIAEKKKGGGCGCGCNGCPHANACSSNCAKQKSSNEKSTVHQEENFEKSNEIE